MMDVCADVDEVVAGEIVECLTSVDPENCR